MAGKIPNDIYQYSLHAAFKAGLTTAGPRATHLPGYGTHGIGYTSEGKTLCLYEGKPMIFASKGDVKNAGDEGLAFIMVVCVCRSSGFKDCFAMVKLLLPTWSG